MVIYKNKVVKNMSDNSINTSTESVESPSTKPKKKLKTIVIVAVAFIVAIGVFSLFGGNKSEKALEEYIAEYYNDEIKKIKEVWSKEYEVDLGYNNWVDTEAVIYQVIGEDLYYACLVTTAGDYVDIEAQVYSKKSDMKDGLKELEEGAKYAIKDGKKEGIIK